MNVVLVHKPAFPLVGSTLQCGRVASLQSVSVVHVVVQRHLMVGPPPGQHKQESEPSEHVSVVPVHVPASPPESIAESVPLVSAPLESDGLVSVPVESDAVSVVEVSIDESVAGGIVASSALEHAAKRRMTERSERRIERV